MKQPSKLRVIVPILMVMAAAAGTIAASGGIAGYQLRLDFTNADGVVRGNDVTINGVKVGQVKDLKLRDSVAVITVSVNSDYAPLPSQSKAIIRSVGLLGNKYVELVPGPRGAGKLDNGSEIGIDSTTSPTDLDQLTAIFDAPTRDKLKAMTLQGKIALGGRAKILNQDLAQLRNLAVAAEPITEILDQHQVALDRATVAFDTLTQKLAKENSALRDLVGHAGPLLASIATKDAQLGDLLAHGDATFSRLDAALNGNEDSLAGFFARGPSAINSEQYLFNSGIPVLAAAAPLIGPLDELLYNMYDTTTGRYGPGNPGQVDASTVWALRPLAVVCDTVAPSDANNRC